MRRSDCRFGMRFNLKPEEEELEGLRQSEQRKIDMGEGRWGGYPAPAHSM